MMKWKPNLSICLFLVLLLTILSCEKSQLEKLDNFDATSVLNEYNKNRTPGMPEGFILTGSIIIGLVEDLPEGDHRIGVLINANESSISDNLFNLQIPDAIKMGKNNIDQGQLTFLGRQLIIEDLEGNYRGLLSLQTDVMDFENVSFSETFWGFGLSKSSINSRFSRDMEPPAANCSCSMDHHAECQAGGPGATGCSISCGYSECSVTCQSQYFACCNCE